MADVSDHGPTITKKGNFDGWYKYLKNHFEIKFPFLVILMGGITDPKTILQQNFLFWKFNGLYKQ